MLYDIKIENPPDKLYFDTSFLITSLVEVPSQKFRFRQARNFLDRIVSKQPKVFTSLLTEIEFIEACVYLALSPIIGKGVREALKTRPQLFQTHKETIDKYIDRYKWMREKLAGNWNELAIDRQVIKLARECSQTYNLMFKDGVHLASARLLFCDNIVSLDRDFSSIKSINQYTLIKAT